MWAPQSDNFKCNKFFWNLFGIWPGKFLHKYYKYFSFFYISINVVIYNILLTINLFYTPKKIEMFIQEVIFYFTEIGVTVKVLMILINRKKIVSIFDLMDCDEFNGEDPDSMCIVKNYNYIYKIGWKTYASICNLAYISVIFIPILVSFIWNAKLELPVCKYYFLADDMKNEYFIYLFIYQSFGMYGHMMYNINVDTFIAGLILIAVSQIKVLQYKLTNLKRNPKLNCKGQEQLQILELNKYLRHYDIILRYCSGVQDILDVVVFVQFGMASVIICVTMYGLLLLSTKESLAFMVTYFSTMLSQIFIPSFLGTLLSYESENLVFAAYSSEWTSGSEKFKRSLKLFMERAKSPIVLTGLKLFPLSLGTFTSVMKTAYSFLTLVRNVQDRQDENI
ncbi:odorant receptor 46a-like [Achroia grisella]|uniref:odorant receptor 46a-like n=1 Tax=Achroia grisella TaxID=688607 RepID=UPI0027D2CF7A|nr:odorant receptor 46a-like [Achroia grisella]